VRAGVGTEGVGYLVSGYRNIGRYRNYAVARTDRHGLSRLVGSLQQRWTSAIPRVTSLSRLQRYSYPASYIENRVIAILSAWRTRAIEAKGASLGSMSYTPLRISHRTREVSAGAHVPTDYRTQMRGTGVRQRRPKNPEGIG